MTDWKLQNQPAFGSLFGFSEQKCLNEFKYFSDSQNAIREECIQITAPNKSGSQPFLVTVPHQILQNYNEAKQTDWQSGSL